MRLANYIKNSVVMLEFPELRQTYNYDCGASALQSVLIYYGHNVREDEVMKMAGTSENGTTPAGIEKVAQSYGLEVRKDVNMTQKDLMHYIDLGYPIMMPIQAWPDNPEDIDYSLDEEDGHWIICVGRDHEKFYFEDPSSVVRATIEFDKLDSRWHDADENLEKLDHFGMVIIGIPKYRYNDTIVMEDTCI
jgi:ABC-type bacteriocin/lantibiotic exporter with double-glycine peptidase domain